MLNGADFFGERPRTSRPRRVRERAWVQRVERLPRGETVGLPALRRRAGADSRMMATSPKESYQIGGEDCQPGMTFWQTRLTRNPVLASQACADTDGRNALPILAVTSKVGQHAAEMARSS